jgi:hypothetical protein
MKKNILIIDDDLAYCQTFKNLAGQYAFDLIFAHNLEDGIARLKENGRLLAVVLDGHCFLEPGQAEVPKVNFVYHALHALDDMEREQQRLIPRCVNTEQPAEFREELQGLVKVFDKQGDAGVLFRWIRKVISELPETRIREEYDDIFEHTQKIFNHLEEDELIGLLLFGETPVEADISANLAVLRRLLEKLTDVCALQLLKEDSRAYASKMGVSVKPVFDTLYSRRILPRQLVKQVHQLYSYCSEFGTHIYRSQKPNYQPDIYAYRRNLNSFLEVLKYCACQIESE